jgi:hypothetical protein
MTPGRSCSVPCYCGAVWTGARGVDRQIVSCSSCGRRLFIFPASPWLEIAAQDAPTPASVSLARRDWLRIVLAVAFTFLLLAGLIFVFLYSQRNRPPPPSPDRAEEVRKRLDQAERWLRQGEFRRADEELRKLNALVPHASLSSDETRAFKQLQAEAGVLADLSAEPLEDLLRHAATGSEEEWETEFAARYRGKSVIFDAEVYPVEGEWRLDYPLGPAAKARLTLEGVSLFGHIPEKTRQRAIFGVRLKSIRLETTGWVIRFEPDSAVFLTQGDAAAHACPPLGEPGARDLLARQAEWLGK